MIFCVEDDRGIRELIVYTLNNTGFETIGFENAEQMREKLKTTTPELFLLDIMLPGEDGISILKSIRKDSKLLNVPVMMLTAKTTEYDKVLGLDNGADDYITKPFGMMELISRVRAMLRRSSINQTTTSTGEEESLTKENITVFPKRHIVMNGEEKVTLTLKEYEMLLCLLRNRGIVMTREVLLSKIWGYDFDGETRTVDVHIRSLRQKIEDNGQIIETVRGVGYRID